MAPVTNMSQYFVILSQSVYGNTSMRLGTLGSQNKYSGLCTKRDKKVHLCDLIVILGLYPSLDKQNVNMGIVTAKLH
jgi:hypothetical protein